MTESRISAIAHAAKMLALEQLVREIGIEKAASAIEAMDDRTPRERDKHRRSAILAEYDRLMKLGGDPTAAKNSVLDKFSAKDKPLERDNLDRNIRRWRPRRNSGQSPGAASEST